MPLVAYCRASRAKAALSVEGEVTHDQLISRAVRQGKGCSPRTEAIPACVKEPCGGASAGMPQHSAGWEAQQRTSIRPPELEESTQDSVAGRLVVCELGGLCVLGDGGKRLVSETGGGRGGEAATRRSRDDSRSGTAEESVSIGSHATSCLGHPRTRALCRR